MVLIQLLLPTRGAAGGEGLAQLAETRQELADRFNGLTAYLRSPAKGWWTAPDGHTEQGCRHGPLMAVARGREAVNRDPLVAQSAKQAAGLSAPLRCAR